MSWPALACASAAMVIRVLLSADGMESIWSSTFFFSAHPHNRDLVALLAPGTQWSQKPIDSLPAALAVRTNGAASSVADAAADVATNRRREILRFCMLVSS